RRLPPHHPHHRGAADGVGRDHAAGRLRGATARRGQLGDGQAGEPARHARVDRPEAPLPRQDGRERRRAAADVLRRPDPVPLELRHGQLRRLRMKRALLVLALAVGLALVPLAAGAGPGLKLKALDTTGYPTIRATLVAPSAADSSPTLTENGRKVLDLNAE